MPYYGLCLKAEELQQPSKTGHFDCTVLLDLPRHRWLGPVLAARRRATGGDGLLFPFKMAALRLVFQRAAAAIGASCLRASLYSLRHGGASHDRATDARSIAAIQGRGQWASARSMRRYEKQGRITLQLQKLPRAVLSRLLAEERLGSESFAQHCVGGPASCARCFARQP